MSPELAPAPPASLLQKFVNGVLLPYLLVRAVLTGALWAAVGLRNGGNPPSLLDKGFWLYGWVRWDSAWYLRIAREGYAPVPDLRQESSIAFFPAYPYLIRGLHALLPEAWQGEEARVWLGLILSNLFILVALGLVHYCCEHYFGSGVDADRTVLYMLVFPAGFFFFSLYTESLFLLASVAAFFFAFRQQWWLAGLMGLVLGMSRPTGIMLAPALAWLYMAQRGWQWRKVRWNVLAMGLIPLGFALVAYNAYLKSGDPMGVFKIQQAWLRTFTSPLVTFQPLNYPHPLVDPASRVLLVLFLVLGVLCLRALSTPALGIFALLSMIPLWFTSTLTSVPRMLVVLFPIFALVSRHGRNSLVHNAVLLTGMTFQVLFVAMWAAGYFVA